MMETCGGILCCIGQSDKEVPPRRDVKACEQEGPASDELNPEQPYKGVFIDYYTKLFFG